MWKKGSATWGGKKRERGPHLCLIVSHRRLRRGHELLDAHKLIFERFLFLVGPRVLDALLDVRLVLGLAPERVSERARARLLSKPGGLIPQLNEGLGSSRTHLDLLFQLLNLVVHNLELALHFGDLVLQRRSLDDTCWLLAQQRAYSAHTARIQPACSSRMQLASAGSCWLLAYGSRAAQRTCDSMRFFE